MGGCLTGLIIVFSAVVLIALALYISARLGGINKIEYSRSFSRNSVYEGQKVYIIETIYNRSFMPLFFIDVEMNIYGGLAINGHTRDEAVEMQYFRSRFSLMPFMQIKRKHEITCVKRGFYRLETADIYFARSTRFIESKAELYVFPKPLPYGDLPFPENSLQGSYLSNAWLIQDPFSISGVREYRGGDPFNSINFKATAKTGALRVNSRDYCSDRTLMVYMNFQAGTDTIDLKAYESMMEKGLSFASAIIRNAIEQGLRAGFAANSRTLREEKYIKFSASGGSVHLESILKEMSRIRATAGYSFVSMLDSDIDRVRDAEIFIVTPYICGAAEKQIELLRRSGNTVNVLLLEFEKSEEVGKISV